MPEPLGAGSAAPEPRPDTPQVLPDFCSGETVLRVFVVVGLLALAAALLRDTGDPLTALAPILIFVVWVAFSSLLVLCLLQRWLRRLPLLRQVVFPALLPVVNTAVVHLGAERFFFADSENRLRVIAVAALLSLVAMRYFYLVAAWRRETQLVAQAREQALRARVRPHFLFNSMNTIAGLCRSDPARAEQITLDLADLFRATFATPETHSLADELELVRAYLDIEQTRFGDRLKVSLDIGQAEGLALRVPGLVLLPLVENAIQHGIGPARGGGHVWLRVLQHSNEVTIEIRNTVGDRTEPGTHTAGEEARARLRHCFGDRARVTVRRSDGLFELRVTLPLKSNQSCEAK
jgi:two-component system, LytTR family, sensor histidine kinase AlgZ